MTPDSPASQIIGIQRDVASLTGRVVLLEGYNRDESSPHLRRVEKFMTEFQTREAEREKVAIQRHQDNQHKMGQTNNRIVFWGVVVAFFAALCALGIGYLTIKAMNHAEANPFSIFGPNTQSFQYTADDRPPQNAIIQPMKP